MCVYARVRLRAPAHRSSLYPVVVVVIGIGQQHSSSALIGESMGPGARVPGLQRTARVATIYPAPKLLLEASVYEAESRRGPLTKHGLNVAACNGPPCLHRSCWATLSPRASL